MKKILLINFIIFISIVLILLLFNFVELYNEINNPSIDNDFKESYSLKYIYNDKYGYDLKPNNIFKDSKGIIYITNDENNRFEGNKKNYLHTSAGKKLHIVGCSQAFGQGVSYENTFSAILQNKFHFNTTNYAVPGFGTIGSFIKLFDRTKNFDENDYVVYLFWDDHLNRNVINCLESPLPICINRPVASYNYRNEIELKPTDNSKKPFNQINNLIKLNKLLYSLTYTPDYIFYKIKKIFSRNDFLKNKNYKKKIFRDFLSKSNKEIISQNSKLIVIYLPNYLSNETLNPLDEEFIKFFSQNQISYIDLYENIKNLNLEKIKLDDGHISEFTHQLIAYEVNNLLKN